MIILALVLFGLCLGSFVNALVWRVHEQEKVSSGKKPDKKYLKKLSILNGRSMCPDCKHELAVKDLLPVISWLSTGGKCRYCGKPISPQYPLVEAITSAIFVASYIWWPNEFDFAQKVLFVIWLLVLTGLMSLLVYDLRWKLLPDRIMAPLAVIAGVGALINVIAADKPAEQLLNVILAVAVGGGIFYVLYQVSKGKWIGGGDVKLGWLLGLVVGTPARSLLFIFLASFLGTFVSLPLLATKRLTPKSTVPFGPFLIAAAIIVQLFGHDILHWYQQTFLSFTL